MSLHHLYFPIWKREAMVSLCEVACQLNSTLLFLLSSSSPSSDWSLPTLRPPLVCISALSFCLVYP